MSSVLLNPADPGLAPPGACGPSPHRPSRRLISLAQHPLRQGLPTAAAAFGPFARAAFRRFFVGAPAPQFPEQALALHLALQNAQRRIDIIVPDKNLHLACLPFPIADPTAGAPRRYLRPKARANKRQICG